MKKTLLASSLALVASFAYAEQELNYHRRYFKMSMSSTALKTSCTKTTLYWSKATSSPPFHQKQLMFATMPL